MQRLTVYAGPVSSGKTSRAMLHYLRAARFGPVLALRPEVSKRDFDGADEIVTKNGLRAACLSLKSALDIVEVVVRERMGLEGDGVLCVWIDEPMLFPDEEEVWNAVSILRESCEVILSGCPATSELRPFGESFPKLIAVADDVVWCKADCDFTGQMGTASRSICLADKKGDVLVGGTEVYRAASPEGWTKKTSAV